jgi:GTP-binding protein HflX
VLADLDLLDRPRLRVFNKTDRLDPELAENLCAGAGALGVSALRRDTLRPLLAEVEARVWRGPPTTERAADWMPEVLADDTPSQPGPASSP